MKSLGPHLWPASSVEMRVRVVIALVLLAAAKVATVYVPILFRDLVDLFSNPDNLPLALPLGLLVGYGLLRIASSAF